MFSYCPYNYIAKIKNLNLYEIYAYAFWPNTKVENSNMMQHLNFLMKWTIDYKRWN